ncbi:MAG: cyclodeaminase/cyclohydrolase family protein [Acidaminococcaceae bacterium]|nr:cyclodeaminase/cyclohydrolase family protein [Acidaminococcaceae bacterium]
MQLTEMTTQQFIDLLASAAPAPGGGSAAALAGAQGCALGAMVCALSIGKTKYAEFETLDKEVQTKLLALKDSFLTAMDEDTETFGVMTDVFAMPKNTEEEKAARRAAMQDALKVCTKIPFAMLSYCVEALKNIEAIVGKSNQSAASDLGVAAVSLSTAVRGAWLNVLINIGGIKDSEFVQDKKDQGVALVAEAEKLAENIYKDIAEAL